MRRDAYEDSFGACALQATGRHYDCDGTLCLRLEYYPNSDLAGGVTRCVTGTDIWT
jgi:hypothetical protein